MKRLAVSDTHIIPSVWRKGNDLMSIMWQTTFQVFLDYVGVGHLTGELQQSQTERPVWSGGIRLPDCNLGKFWLFKIRRFKFAAMNEGPKELSVNVSRHILLVDLQALLKIQEGNSSN